MRGLSTREVLVYEKSEYMSSQAIVDVVGVYSWISRTILLDQSEYTLGLIGV